MQAATRPVLSQPSNADGITEQGRAALESAMRYRTVHAGSYVFSEGEPAGRLYLLVRGRIKLTKASSDGKMITFSLYDSGDLFGQWTPFTDTVHTLNAEAMEDSEIGVIERRDLERLIAGKPDLAGMMLQWLGQNQARLESKLRDLMLYGKTGALSSVLIRLANTYGMVYGSDVCISLKVTNSDLADMIGSTREGVNRILSDMKQEGLIAYWNGHLVLKSMEHLRRMCHCDQCPVRVCRL